VGRLICMAVLNQGLMPFRDVGGQRRLAAQPPFAVRRLVDAISIAFDRRFLRFDSRAHGGRQFRVLACVHTPRLFTRI
jgi:hypothetical protein